MINLTPQAIPFNTSFASLSLPSSSQNIMSGDKVLTAVIIPYGFG